MHVMILVVAGWGVGRSNFFTPLEENDMVHLKVMNFSTVRDFAVNIHVDQGVSPFSGEAC